MNTVGYWKKSIPINQNKIAATDITRFAMSSMYSIDFFLFTAKDVDLKKKTINGLFWDKENLKFFRKETIYPKLIDFRMGGNLHKLHPEIFSEFKENSYIVTSNLIGSKSENNKWLEKTKFKENTIPTSNEISKEKLNEMLDMHNKIILKPSTGSNGRGIYKISKTEDGLVDVHYETEKYITKIEEFLENNETLFKEKKYLVQAYIESTSLEGNPMDVRLNLARRSKGIWEISGLYLRLGGSSYIGTNMGKEQKSNSINVLDSLKYQFGEEEGNKVYNKIQKMALEFPEIYQKKLKFTTPELCLDLGIDRETKQIYIFEVGVSPGNTAMPADKVPIHNVEFYNYLLRSVFPKIKENRVNTIKSGGTK